MSCLENNGDVSFQTGLKHSRTRELKNPTAEVEDEDEDEDDYDYD